MEQIAARVGISTRSFNRYFPTKEDAALGDTQAWGILVRDALVARPGDEPVWDSLEAALGSLLTVADMTGDRPKGRMRVLTSTASLRARNLEKHLAWTETLTPIIAERLPGGTSGQDAALRARAIVQSAIACFESALHAWAAEGETCTPLELLRISFGALRRA